MKTNNRTSKTSRLMKGTYTLALLCSIALPAGITSVQAQSLDSYDSYSYDMDNAPQISGSNHEFFLGQSVQTQPQGSLQMIIGGSHERSSADQGSQRFSEIKARAEYGVTDRLQLQAELPYQIDDRPGSFTSQDNVGNVQVGAAYSLLRADDPISMTAGMDVQIPVGHQANLNRMDVRGSDQTIYKPQLIVARDFGPTQVHANAQAELGTDVRGLNYNVSAVLPVGRVAPSLEMNARTMNQERPQFYATPGISYAFSDRAQVGVGVPLGLNDQSTSASVMAKFSLQLP
jgi:hypothetical protein